MDADVNQLNEDRSRILKKRDELLTRRKELQPVVDEIQPVVETSVALVQTITKEQLDEVKALKKPPAVIKKAIEMVYMMLNYDRNPHDLDEMSWDQAKRFLAPDLAQNVQQFDASLLAQHPFIIDHIAITYLGMEHDPEGVFNFKSLVNSMSNGDSLKEHIARRKGERKSKGTPGAPVVIPESLSRKSSMSTPIMTRRRSSIAFPSSPAAKSGVESDEGDGNSSMQGVVASLFPELLPAASTAVCAPHKSKSSSNGLMALTSGNVSINTSKTRSLTGLKLPKTTGSPATPENPKFPQAVAVTVPKAVAVTVPKGTPKEKEKKSLKTFVQKMNQDKKANQSDSSCLNSSTLSAHDSPPLSFGTVSYANRTCGALFRWVCSQLQYATTILKHGPVLEETARVNTALAAIDEELQGIEEELSMWKNRQEALGKKRQLARDAQQMELIADLEAAEAKTRKAIEDEAAAQWESMMADIGMELRCAQSLEEMAQVKRPKPQPKKPQLSHFLKRSWDEDLPNQSAPSGHSWFIQPMDEPTEPEVVINEVVSFCRGSITLQEEHIEVLDTVIEKLIAHDGVRVLVEGRREELEPVDMAERRAHVVREYLLDHGISSGRMLIMARGDHPIRRGAGIVRFDVVQEIKITERVGFDANSSEVHPRNRLVMESVTHFLRLRPDVRVRIEGHSCTDGDLERNKKLSLKRAENVREYLTEQGIKASRLDVAGYGSLRPLVSGGSPAGKSQNRRVAFQVLMDQRL